MEFEAKIKYDGRIDKVVSINFNGQHLDLMVSDDGACSLYKRTKESESTWLNVPLWTGRLKA